MLLVDNANRAANGDPYNTWLLHLVNTRDIWIMPNTNSLGYYQNVREENGVDPNRDFPYNIFDGNCMNSIAARAVNEVWRDNLFQLSLTYHGGMQAISYEWGANNHPVDTESPDDSAQAAISGALTAYAGSFLDDMKLRQVYPIGRLNDLVYPVDGGMEDWGYAASWETASSAFPSAEKPCTPRSYGGYPVSKTQYSKDMLRAFNILVETSDLKMPHEASLGSDAQLLLSSGTGDGHIPRNIRLALLVADIVQPYIQWTTPFMYSNATFANPKHPSVMVVASDSTSATVGVNLAWEVGGGMVVDSTQLSWGPWPQRPLNFDSHGCTDGLSSGCVGVGASWFDGVYVSGTSEATLGGKTRWASAATRDMGAQPYLDAFTGCVTVPMPSASQGYADYFAVVSAKLDSQWTAQRNPEPNIPQQSHIVNARSNTNWRAANGNATIVGQDIWYSWPIRIRVQRASNSTAPGTTKTTPTTTASPHSTTATTAAPTVTAKGFASPVVQPDCLSLPSAQCSSGPPSPIALYIAIAVVAALLPVLVATTVFCIKYRRRARPYSVSVAGDEEAMQEMVIG